MTLYGQTRILFAMGRDGMLPESFPRVSPRTQTPVNNTIIVAIVVALLAGFVPLDYLVDLRRIGTLIAFIVVVDRRDHPAAYGSPTCRAGSRCRAIPVTPILAILACIWIIKDLRPVTIYVFLIWVAVAMVWYAVYGFRHSHLGRHEHVGLIHD